MLSNILITGAAGYIGGSIAADFLKSKSPTIRNANVFAAVRSEEQSRALSKLSVNVLQLSLSDEKAVIESLKTHRINIVIHTASSIDADLALPLLNALGKVKETTGEETFFVHTSGLSAFYPETGWRTGEFEDTGPVFETEKQLADTFPIRKTDVTVIEHAKALGVTSFIVVPCTVYGKGSGEWNKLSVVFPPYISASISSKKVHKFPDNTKVSWVHISDLTALYGLLVEKILQAQPIENGEKGYYFALAHDAQWWEVLNRLAAALKARGLIANSEIDVWPSDEAAAEAMDVPPAFVQPLWNSGEEIKANNERRLGWKPSWNKERFLSNIDDEIDAVLEEGKAKSSLMDSLRAAGKG